jgi:hypothetical protein
MGGHRVELLSDPTTAAVGGLAVYRLTRLLVEDEVTRPARERITEAAPEGRLAYFVTCPWCVSMWVGAAWAALVVTAPPVATAAGAALAWSAVAGLLSTWE